MPIEVHADCVARRRDIPTYRQISLWDDDASTRDLRKGPSTRLASGLRTSSQEFHLRHPLGGEYGRRYQQPSAHKTGLPHSRINGSLRRCS